MGMLMLKPKIVNISPDQVVEILSEENSREKEKVEKIVKKVPNKTPAY